MLLVHKSSIMTFVSTLNDVDIQKQDEVECYSFPELNVVFYMMATLLDFVMCTTKEKKKKNVYLRKLLSPNYP